MQIPTSLLGLLVLAYISSVGAKNSYSCKQLIKNQYWKAFIPEPKLTVTNIPTPALENSLITLMVQVETPESGPVVVYMTEEVKEKLENFASDTHAEYLNFKNATWHFEESQIPRPKGRKSGAIAGRIPAGIVTARGKSIYTDEAGVDLVNDLLSHHYLLPTQRKHGEKEDKPFAVTKEPYEVLRNELVSLNVQLINPNDQPIEYLNMQAREMRRVW